MSDRRDQVVVIADVSPSMEARDGGSREGKTRFQLLRDALNQLPKEIKMSKMNSLSLEIDMVANDTTELYKLRSQINGHIHGEVSFNDLPVKAQEIINRWEIENKLAGHENHLAIQYRAKRKNDIDVKDL